MKSDEFNNERIMQVTDLLENIEDVNRMIELHQQDADSFTLSQYTHRKENFVKELAKLLRDFKISIKDLAA